MSKKPLKVGDRVVCYGHDSKGMRLHGLRGEIFAFLDPCNKEIVYVEFEHEKERSACHVKQLRRLKPRKRQEFWLNILETKYGERSFSLSAYVSKDQAMQYRNNLVNNYVGDPVRFVEAKEKK